MLNNTLQRIVQVLGFIFLLTLLPAAHALQITMSVPDCPAGQSLSFNSSSNLLSCTGTATVTTPGNCTITALPPSTASGTPGPLTAPATVVLTPSCATGDPVTVYNWSNSSQTTAAAPDLTLSNLSANQTISVTPSNNSGSAAQSPSITIYVGTQVGPVPSGCSITQSPNTSNAAVAPGTTVLLTANCTVGTPLTTCSWNSLATTSCTNVPVAPASSTTYSVTPSNTVGPASSSATTTVNVVTPGSNALNFCTGVDQIINIAWPPTEQSQLQTRGFTQNNLAFKLIIPSSFNPALNPLHTGYISMVEVPGAIRTSREVTVSKNSCDFSVPNAMLYSAGGTSPGFQFAVDNPTGFAALNASVNFNSGDVVYVNVRNTYRGATTCPIGKNCDVLFNFKTPNSY